MLIISGQITSNVRIVPVTALVHILTNVDHQVYSVHLLLSHVYPWTSKVEFTPGGRQQNLTELDGKMIKKYND